jgi:hypothetical protein
VAGTHSYVLEKYLKLRLVGVCTHLLHTVNSKQWRTPIGRSVHTLAPYCGHIDGSANGDKGQHSNVSDMAIHAEDSGIFDRSVPDSHTTDAYNVDHLNSD